MSDENSLRDDITFLRQMAESGRRGPILGGIFLAAAGLVFGCASIIDWLGHSGLTPISPRQWSELTVWGGAGLVFTAFWLVMFFRMMRASHPIASASNATFGTIWSACGIGVMVCFLTTMLISRELNAGVVLSAYVPVIYAFYGTAWFASAALARRNWMYVAAVASYLFAFVIAMLTENDLQSVAMGVGLFALLTLPGVKLVLDERRS